MQRNSKKTEKSEIEEKNLSYKMDLYEDSRDYLHTPPLWANQLPFYLESYGHFYAGESYFTRRKGLKSFLLIYTKSGTGIIESRGESITVRAGMVVVIDCLKYQHYRTKNGCNWEFEWIHFNGISAGCYFDLINSRTLVPVQLKGENEIDDILEETVSVIKSGSMNKDFMFSEFITRILTRIILAKSSNIKNCKYINHRENIMKSIETIQRRYAEKISMTELAKQSHISKYYFVRIFKEYTGQTPYEYLISQRLDRSKRLLTGTGLSVSRISSECGFEDTSNYIRCFKRATGMTPGKFRKEMEFVL